MESGESPQICTLRDVQLETFDRNTVRILRASGISDDDFQSIFQGIDRIVREVGLILTIASVDGYFEDSPENKNIGFPENVLMNADFGHGPLIQSSKLGYGLAVNNIRNPQANIDCFVFPQDTTDAGSEDGVLDWAYGFSVYPIIGISTARWNIENIPQGRNSALQIVAAHELCHAYGLVERNTNIGTEGLELNHCMGESGPCIMEQVEVGRRTIHDLALDIRKQTHFLCTDCHKEIQKNIQICRAAGILV